MTEEELLALGYPKEIVQQMAEKKANSQRFLAEADKRDAQSREALQESLIGEQRPMGDTLATGIAAALPALFGALSGGMEGAGHGAAGGMAAMQTADRNWDAEAARRSKMGQLATQTLDRDAEKLRAAASKESDQYNDIFRQVSNDKRAEKAEDGRGSRSNAMISSMASRQEAGFAHQSEMLDRRLGAKDAPLSSEEASGTAIALSRAQGNGLFGKEMQADVEAAIARAKSGKMTKDEAKNWEGAITSGQKGASEERRLDQSQQTQIDKGIAVVLSPAKIERQSKSASTLNNLQSLVKNPSAATDGMLVTQMARGLSGEVGTMNEGDILRVMPKYLEKSFKEWSNRVKSGTETTIPAEYREHIQKAIVLKALEVKKEIRNARANAAKSAKSRVSGFDDMIEGQVSPLLSDEESLLDNVLNVKTLSTGKRVAIVDGKPVEVE